MPVCWISSSTHPSLKIFLSDARGYLADWTTSSIDHLNEPLLKEIYLLLSMYITKGKIFSVPFAGFVVDQNESSINCEFNYTFIYS